MSNAVKLGLTVLAVAVLAGAAWFVFVAGEDPTTGVTAPPVNTPTTAGEEETTTAPSATAPEEAAEVFELTEESRAIFELDEELNQSPNTVTGTSSIVLGQIRLDRDDLAATEIGTILVNARDFETDSRLRDRAIDEFILDTGEHEFIEFVPTAVEGLSGPAVPGETAQFSVTGDLTIRDITRPVTFQVEATLTEDDRIEGVATATVSRGDFELEFRVPSQVANVEEEVDLTVELVAAPTG